MFPAFFGNILLVLFSVLQTVAAVPAVLTESTNFLELNDVACSVDLTAID